MNITYVYKKGMKDINEDTCVINHDARIYAAIDGASGLDGVPGYIASQVVQDELHASEQKNNTLHERIHAANEKLGEKMIAYYQKTIAKLTKPTIGSIPKKQRSSTGVAAIQLDEDHSSFDYVHAADCMLFLLYENGDVRPMTYDLLDYLDQIAIDEIVRLRAMEGNDALNMGELREMVNPILLKNRGKLNTNEGYGVIDGSNEAMDHLEWGRVSLKRVKKILLLSDGLLLPAEYNEENVWEKTARIAFDKGLDGLVEEVELRELGDPDCRSYPRLKTKDDKTGILLGL